MYPMWPLNALAAPKKSWRSWLRRGMSGEAKWPPDSSGNWMAGWHVTNMSLNVTADTDYMYPHVAYLYLCLINSKISREKALIGQIFSSYRTQSLSLIKDKPNKLEQYHKMTSCIHKQPPKTIHSFYCLHLLIVPLISPDYSNLTPSTPSIFLFWILKISIHFAGRRSDIDWQDFFSEKQLKITTWKKEGEETEERERERGMERERELK